MPIIFVFSDEPKSNRRKVRKARSSSNSSRISTRHIQLIIEKLKGQTKRSSTSQTYLNVWRQFNKFVISLDVKPPTWKDRVTLFIGYKIDNGMQSSSVKSYLSAIKKLLIEDGCDWDDQKVLLGSLTSACKPINDRVYTRLPIQCSLLEMILFEVQRIYRDEGQQYLEILYLALFSLSYYGMMRVGELTCSDHVLKARDIHAAMNKDKLMIMLYSSKTHSTAKKPQKIKITSNLTEKSGFYAKRNFCRFLLMNNYFSLRFSIATHCEQFFTFRDGTPVKPNHAGCVLRTCLSNLGLEASYYGMHSFRIGQTTDLIKSNFYSIEEVKHMGRWCLNTIYKYIRL